MRAYEKELFSIVREPINGKALNRLTVGIQNSFPSVRVGCIGRSILGEEIPVYSFGKGESSVLYVGAHHGMEWITANLLAEFVLELAILQKHGGRAYGKDIRALLEQRILHVVPLLNPDGVTYQQRGLQSGNPLHERVLRMNQESLDFSHWQANARGVDLNHNYAAGFWECKKIETESGILGGCATKYSGEFPESEPETAALCNFIRIQKNLCGVMTLHTQGEEIFYASNRGILPDIERIAKKISSICQYRLSHAMGSSAYGGLTDWCVQEMGVPSFTLECGKGENPLPISCRAALYIRLRELFFRFPYLLTSTRQRFSPFKKAVIF